MPIRAITPWLLLLTALCGPAAAVAEETPASGAEAAPLTLGFMPYLNAEHLIEKYTPLAQYLGAALQRPVRITVAKDYAEHIRRTGEDRLDISFLGGSPYVVIGDRYRTPKPLLARYAFEGSPVFRSVVFAARDSPLQSLAELRGRRMAFGNINSTLSTQVPLYMLMQAGVGLDDLGASVHLRNHENVVLGVVFGDFDAGAVAEEVFEENQHQPIRLLAASPGLSTHVFVTRSDLPPSLQARIRQALLALDPADPPQRAVLQAISPKLTGFVPVQDADYDLHRAILSRVLPVLGQ